MRRFEPRRTNVRRLRTAEPSAANSSRRLMLMRSFAIFDSQYALLCSFSIVLWHIVAFFAPGGTHGPNRGRPKRKRGPREERREGGFQNLPPFAPTPPRTPRLRPNQAQTGAGFKCLPTTSSRQGQPENSLAFQCQGRFWKGQSPAGTTENRPDSTRLA